MCMWRITHLPHTQLHVHSARTFQHVLTKTRICKTKLCKVYDTVWWGRIMIWGRMIWESVRRQYDEAVWCMSRCGEAVWWGSMIRVWASMRRQYGEAVWPGMQYDEATGRVIVMDKFEEAVWYEQVWGISMTKYDEEGSMMRKAVWWGSVRRYDEEGSMRKKAVWLGRYYASAQNHRANINFAQDQKHVSCTIGEARERLM